MSRSLDFERDGVSVETGIVAQEDFPPIRAFVDLMVSGGAGGRSYSLPPDVQQLAGKDGALGSLARSLAGRTMQPVRYLCFDKTDVSNWGLPWHQDRLLALQRRIDVEGFGPWSIKAGVPHAEPPIEFLNDMVTLRLHLDDCGLENGPLQVVPGSCHEGRIPAADISRFVEEREPAACVANAGDVVAMRGLTVHSSRPAEHPDHRRVLHIDYSSLKLPDGLEWAVT